ncbi:MAG TPA: FAD-dependent monooxygenase [Trebonia sp.]|jgi:2-polyprenyl-6-methoxyphenol hydroxylase-like FAD-dependent oxidoreductase|nr:FAD-dependent monooxygenase [Trebonia sp.]
MGAVVRTSPRSDPRAIQLLRQSGKLNGSVVAGTLTGDDVCSDKIIELRHLVRRWPSPWRYAIGPALDRRDFIGTPVAEYLPSQLARESAALIGDAAHVVSPITGAGFHNGLLDVQALTAALRTAPPGRIQQALNDYQQRRIQPARGLVAQSQQWSRTYVSSSH